MRNQFFGDNRDLFKYDLIFEIVRAITAINQFTFIPMLTPNKGTHGNQIERNKAKAGFKNISLKQYLDKCIMDGKRNICHIKEYFIKENVVIKIYKESNFFIHKSRNQYFIAIPEECLYNSLIFIDPDNGLEIKKSNNKHIKYSEVKDIYNRMKNSSVLMIYQHFPREDHKFYIKRRLNELQKESSGIPLFISDNEIIFFFLAKQRELSKQLAKILENCSIRYPKLLYESK